MKNNGMKIKHPKLRGEWAEMCFMTRAAEHGLSATRPWGPSSAASAAFWTMVVAPEALPSTTLIMLSRTAGGAVA